MIFFRHLIKIIKFFVKDPLFTIKDFYSDLRKDYFLKFGPLDHNIVWCAGLPKSGTTLIESILDTLPYVRADTSLVRIFEPNPYNLGHYHGVSEKYFKNFPKNKLTFFKTHTHFDPKYIEISQKYKTKIIVSVRDIRDMMISRYFHILSDKKHPAYQIIHKYNFEEGFIKSLTYTYPPAFEVPIIYYYDWILHWKEYAERKKILVLWYENYVNNPEAYVMSILNYLNLDKTFKDKVLKNITSSKKNLSKDLSLNLSKFGKKKSTFRSGKINNWSQYFNKKIEEAFISNLPGPINKIIWVK